MSATVAAAEPDTRYVRLLPVVGRVARDLLRVYRYGEYGDYFQDGCLGMIRALATYDPSRGVPLEAYARPVIARAIVNGIRSRDPVSAHARRLLQQAKKTQEKMELEHRTVPTLAEMADRISGLGAALLMTARADVVSLEDTYGKAQQVAETSEDADPIRVVEARERRDRIRSVIAELTERQRAVLRLRYGERKTVVATARELDLSIGRIAQLEQSVLKRMRRALAEVNDPR